MKILRKNKWSILAAVTLISTLISTFLVIAAYASPTSNIKASGKLWLSHFVGGDVIVQFISAPKDMERTVKARLMDAEIPGIVLKFGENEKEIFFSYSNIITVEPFRK